MQFIALERYLVVVALAAVTFVCTAASPDRGSALGPLQDPVLGLKYDSAKANFEPFPDEAASKCMEYAGTQDWKVGRLWIFASAREANRTYYVVSGYMERRKPAKGQPQYEIDRYGGVVSIENGQCTGYGAAREVFDARYFAEIPQPVLQRLADDLAVRLARGVGGPDQLRAKLSEHRITADSLTPELRAAFRSALPPKARAAIKSG